MLLLPWSKQTETVASPGRNVECQSPTPIAMYMYSHSTLIGRPIADYLAHDVAEAVGEVGVEAAEQGLE